MAIDYIIHYDCIPKQTFGTEEILERIKGKTRAEAIISLYRQRGDDRPPSEMGFEFTRSSPDGEEERRVMHVQTLLDIAAELDPVAHHCQGCPANRTGEPFGCMGYIPYPISHEGEKWLLDRLPTPDDRLIWNLLKEGVKEFQYDGANVRRMRNETGVYLEVPYVITRKLGTFEIDANQVLEMAFSVGHIIPNHAAILLLFFNGIERKLTEDDIRAIVPATPEVRQRHPFILPPDADDEPTIGALKAFLEALYIAWTLNVQLLVDS
jgi:hypothetical protein